MRTLCLILTMLTLACAGEPPPPQGQFGTYHRDNKLLRLASGDTFTVYRVKRWTFNDGAPPALQFEYAPPISVDDTAGLRQLAYRMWPAFAPYVESLGLRGAILIATNINWQGSRSVAYTAQMRSFGLVAHRDSLGVWRLDGHAAPLPPAESGGEPRIFEATGAQLRMNLPQ